MEKSNNDTKKGFMIAVYIFAVIGVISVLALGIKSVISLVNKVKGNDTTVTTVSLDNSDDASNQGSSDGISDSETDALNANESNLGTSDGSNASTDSDNLLGDVKLPEMTESKTEAEAENEVGRYQIVFLGDSIIDNFRDESGICSIVARSLEANVYNLGIGGTCASIGRDDSVDDATWTATCGIGVAKAMNGKIDVNVLRDCTARDILIKHMEDFKNTDIFVVEYGVNDFLFGRSMVDLDNLYNMTTYEGGLRNIVSNLQEVAPDAKIVLCQPSYTEFYRENGEYIGDTYSLNNGPGSEFDYGGKTTSVANDLGCLLFTLDDQGIDSYNCGELLLDGVHLNEAGRSLYASNLSQFLLKNIIDAEE